MIRDLRFRGDELWNCLWYCGSMYRIVLGDQECQDLRHINLMSGVLTIEPSL
jgi:hypothetical protein